MKCPKCNSSEIVKIICSHGLSKSELNRAVKRIRAYKEGKREPIAFRCNSCGYKWRREKTK